MRSICFVTNRPPVTGGFGPPPAPAAPEMLTFGSVAVEPSANPAVSGRTLGPVQRAGSVAVSSPGPDAALVATVGAWLAAARAAKAAPLVMVHGYSYGFLDAVGRSADVCATWEAASGRALWPIVFTWPSVNGLSAENYLADRGRAQASGPALARFVLAFARAWEAAGEPMGHFVAHSMGTWATQNGMRALAAMPDTHLPAPLFDQAMVMGGDADVDALEPGQGLDQLARLSRVLTVGVNRMDFATGVASADVLRRPRLGSSGPGTLARLPPNLRVVDYTIAIAGDRRPTPPGETDWNYKLHQYYRTSPAVCGDIAAMLAGGVPERIPGRFSSAQMRATGQAGVKPGRLYLCPAPVVAMAADQDVPERRG